MSRRRYGYKPTAAPPIAPEFLRAAFARPGARPIGLERCRRCGLAMLGAHICVDATVIRE